jgi:hypothetical protein
MTNKYTHCCGQMQTHIDSNELHLNFMPKLREYGVDYADGGTSSQTIQFCPWCGSKLPLSLRVQWFEELDRLDLEPNDDLPAELKDDTWWLQKRL